MECQTGSFSRISEKCQKCEYKDICKNKRMEAVAYIIPNTTPNAVPDITVSGIINTRLEIW